MGFGSIVQDVLIRIRAQVQDMSGIQTMKDIIPQSKKVVGDLTRVSRVTKSVTSETLKASSSYRSFRFELLSTMFFGQMMTQTMNGLLQPAFQTAGIFDIISTILEVFFLPIALALLDPLLALMDWFLGMPEEVQLVIGAIVLFLAILGGIIVFVSQVGMFLSAFGLSFTTAGGLIMAAMGTIASVVAGGLTAIVSAVAGLPIAIIAIIVLLIVAVLFNIEGFVGAFANYFTNLIDSVQRIFGGLIGIVTGIWDMVVGIFTGNQEQIDKGWKSFFEGIVNFATGIFDLLIGNSLKFAYDLGMAIVTGLGRAYGAIKNAIAGIPIIGPLIVGGLNFVGGIAGGIANAIGGAIGGLGRMIGIPGFAEGGIVTRPTLAMVGEKGPELITPLNGNSSVGNTIYYSPTYEINNELNNNVDVDYMLDEMEKRQANDYERLRKL